MNRYSLLSRGNSTIKASLYIAIFLLLLLFLGLLLNIDGYWRNVMGTTEQPTHTDIESRSGGQINISGHAFRDIQHTGRFEAEDRSLAGLMFSLEQETSASTAFRETTNRAGWANFIMSANRSNAAIQEPGRYQITAHPPDGMYATTDNLSQTFTVQTLTGSISGLTLDAMPKPIGFAPKVHISGMIPNDHSTEVIGADTMESIETKRDRNTFTTETMQPQPVQVTFSTATSSFTRVVPKKFVPIVVSQAHYSPHHQSNAPPTKQEHFFDFTELIDTTEARKIPIHYRGLQWDNITAIHDKFSDGAGYHNTVRYGRAAAYTSSGQRGTISRDEPFSFTSGYFGVAHEHRDGEQIHIRAYNGDELVYEDSFRLSAYFPTFFQADYREITKLTFETEYAWQVVLEGLTFRY